MYACEHHRSKAQANCVLCFADHLIIKRLRAIRERNEAAPPSALCTDITVALGAAIEYIAALDTAREPESVWKESDLPLEQLDEACHCGKDNDGIWCFGTHCPIMSHRARSGHQWRSHYIERYDTAREPDGPGEYANSANSVIWSEQTDAILLAVKADRACIADYIRSCREGGALEHVVQVFDVIAKHIEEGKHLPPCPAAPPQETKDA